MKIFFFLLMFLEPELCDLPRTENLTRYESVQLVCFLYAHGYPAWAHAIWEQIQSVQGEKIEWDSESLKELRQAVFLLPKL